MSIKKFAVIMAAVWRTVAYVLSWLALWVGVLLIALYVESSRADVFLLPPTHAVIAERCAKVVRHAQTVAELARAIGTPEAELLTHHDAAAMAELPAFMAALRHVIRAAYHSDAPQAQTSAQHALKTCKYELGAYYAPR